MSSLVPSALRASALVASRRALRCQRTAWTRSASRQARPRAKPAFLQRQPPTAEQTVVRGPNGERIIFNLEEALPPAAVLADAHAKKLLCVAPDHALRILRRFENHVHGASEQRWTQNMCHEEDAPPAALFELAMLLNTLPNTLPNFLAHRLLLAAAQVGEERALLRCARRIPPNSGLTRDGVRAQLRALAAQGSLRAMVGEARSLVLENQLGAAFALLVRALEPARSDAARWADEPQLLDEMTKVLRLLAYILQTLGQTAAATELLRIAALELDDAASCYVLAQSDTITPTFAQMLLTKAAMAGFVDASHALGTLWEHKARGEAEPQTRPDYKKQLLTLDDEDVGGQVIRPRTTSPSADPVAMRMAREWYEVAAAQNQPLALMQLSRILAEEGKEDESKKKWAAAMQHYDRGV